MGLPVEAVHDGWHTAGQSAGSAASVPSLEVTNTRPPATAGAPATTEPVSKTHAGWQGGESQRGYAATVPFPRATYAEPAGSMTGGPTTRAAARARMPPTRWPTSRAEPSSVSTF